MLTIEALQKAGVNTTEGLTRCMNNQQFYFRLITKVLNSPDFASLKTAIEANDLDTAFTIAHTLKGSTGNLALTPLYQPLAQITELLRTHTQTDYTPYLTAIMDAHQALLKL